MDYVIVGNGVAGTTAAENIRALDEEGSITLVTDEDLPFYYRIRLNDYVAGDLSEQELVARKEQWYKDRRIDLSLGTRVVDADPAGNAVITEKGRKLPYDRLLIATGSRSFVPPIKGSEKKGVFTLRNIRDAREISSYARNLEKVVLIGGGLLGLEAGNALRRLGKQVMVVEFFPRLLPRQLDGDGAQRLQTILEGMGFSFRLGAKTQEIGGREGAEEVLLEGGESLSAGMVVISAGVRPIMDLAEPLGLERDKGIKVDEHLRTSLPDVYAAGDVAEFKGMPYGIWPAAMEQGEAAGVNMAGGDKVYEGTTMATTLKVVGVDLASAGNIDAENKFESRVAGDENTYRKIVLEDDRIIGCIMLGDIKGFHKVTRAMADKKPLSEVADLLASMGVGA